MAPVVIPRHSLELICACFAQVRPTLSPALGGVRGVVAGEAWSRFALGSPEVRVGSWSPDWPHAQGATTIALYHRQVGTLGAGQIVDVSFAQCGVWFTGSLQGFFRPMNRSGMWLRLALSFPLPNSFTLTSHVRYSRHLVPVLEENVLEASKVARVACHILCIPPPGIICVCVTSAPTPCTNLPFARVVPFSRLPCRRRTYLRPRQAHSLAH